MTNRMRQADDRFLVEWLAEGPDRGPEALLERAFKTARRTPQRPSWTLQGWWLPGPFGTWAPRQVAIAIGLALLAGLAVLLVIAGALRSDPVISEMPPDRLTVWLVIENGRSTDVGFLVRGGYLRDAGPDSGPEISGVTHSCSIDVVPLVVERPWSIVVGGQTVLTSDRPDRAYALLSTGGDATLRTAAGEGTALSVRDLVAGPAVQAEGGVPAACAAFGTPVAEVDTPAPFLDSWQITLDAPGGPLPRGDYSISFADDQSAQWVPVELIGEDRRTSYYIRGAITNVDAERVEFMGTPACPERGLYLWAVTDAGSSLTLSVINDTCPARRALLLAGTMTRGLGRTLDPGGRYVVPEFDPPIAFTVPAGLPGTLVAHPNQYSGRSSEDLQYSIPGMGWRLTVVSNVAPMVCGGAIDSLTGEDPGLEPPGPGLPSLAAFRSAFEAWDERQPGVTIGEPRPLTIDGRPAVSIDVMVTEDCPVWPFMPVGGILERLVAIDIGGEIRIARFGPGHHVPRSERDETFYDDALFDFGERLTTSLELVP